MEDLFLGIFHPQQCPQGLDLQGIHLLAADRFNDIFYLVDEFDI